MIVYLLLNQVNQKGYVGQHLGNFVSGRWNTKLAGGNAHFTKAVKKYGWASFSREILNYCCSKEEMNNLEKLWIATLRTYDSEFGYNKTMGADGNLTLEVRKKISKKAYERMQKRVALRVCYGCYKSFDSSKTSSTDGTFCSKKCAEKDRTFLPKRLYTVEQTLKNSIAQKKAAVKNKRTKLRVCYNCFKPIQSTLRNTSTEFDQVFCSYKCKGQLIHYGELKPKYLNADCNAHEFITRLEVLYQEAQE